MGRRVATLEATDCAKDGISEHGRMQLPGFVAFLQSLTDGEATGPAVVGEGELGTFLPGCGGDGWGITCPACPAASAGAQLLLPSISLVSASALAWAFCCSLAKRFLNRGLETNH